MKDRVIDLRNLDWTVEGWREWEWLLGASIESGSERTPDIRPLPARVPGSVRGALRDAGIVADPLHAARSRESEFLEHRHWIFRTQLPDDIGPLVSAKAALRFDSLDGRGEIYLAGERLAEFDNAFVPTVVSIPEGLESTGAELAVVFHSPPADLGQVGWTSRRREWKPRFNYGWDWTPRIVQTAIVGDVSLEIRTGATLGDVRLRANYDASAARGSLEAETPEGGHPDAELELALLDRGQVIARTVTVSAPGHGCLRLNDLAVEPWHPFARVPRRYVARVRLLVDGEPVAEVERTVGFRQVTWERTADAPEDAEPWLCAINGTPVFLQGVNWVPIRPDYADVPDQEYRARLETYRELGVNIIRVWGGAALELPVFYELCDELGLLVWQELPLCSSGLDNYPPDDPAFASEFAAIAESYVHRVGHHACIVIWGVGNELAGGKGVMDMGSAPLTFEHPALDAAREVLERLGVDAKVVPTSPSGPAFFVDPSEQAATNGRGLHHDVHGPWAFDGSEEEWDTYWAQDDSMLRSEVGSAGASGREVLDEFGLWSDGERPAVWEHSSAWWITDEVCTPGSIAASQQRQARRLSVAAQASKDRYPACAGFIVWMGHDAFPCAVSLSLLDVHGTPKPAALALADVFRDAGSPGEGTATGRVG